MSRFITWLLVVTVAGSPCAAIAENLLTNPDFDNALQISGWDCGNPWGTVSWSPEDYLNDQTSGSMEHWVAANDINNATATCTQCVPVTDLLTYTMSGWAYWPDDPDVDQIGTTRFAFGFYANPDCTSSLGSNEVVVANPSTLNEWFQIVSDQCEAPAGATSAYVLVVTWQNFAGMPVRARIDHLDLSSDEIFIGGFESGDTSRWSSAVPF